MTKPKLTKIEGINFHGIESGRSGQGTYKVTIVFDDEESQRTFIDLVSASEEVPLFNEVPPAVLVIDSAQNRYMELIDENGNADLFFISGLQGYEIYTKVTDGPETLCIIIELKDGRMGKIPI